MTSTQQHGLMSEEEVQQYFINNGGVVRNNDIVTYFRNYLSNPAIRDEARALFKVIVNKLATVKIENGEKYLVLKRQFFLPIDGNGNSAGLQQPSSSMSFPTAYGDRRSSSGGLPLSPSGGSYTQGYNQYKATLDSPMTGQSGNFTPFPYQAPLPYVSGGAYPHMQSIPPPSQTLMNSPYQYQHQQISKSQPQLYGSHFSLNSTYTDPSIYTSSPPLSQQPLPKYNRSPVQSSTQLLPMGDYDYGLPPPPLQGVKSPPRRLSFTSPSSSSSSVSSGSGGRMMPPPYRPPPPAPSPTTPTTPFAGSRPKALSFRSPPPPRLFPSTSEHPNNNTHSKSTKLETVHAFPYQRSLSVSGLGNPVCVGVKKGSHSASPPTDNQPPFFPLPISPTSDQEPPPPPVPPRAKRSSSFLEKAPLDSSTSAASTVAMEETQESPAPPDMDSEHKIDDKENDTPLATLDTESTDDKKMLDAEEKISVRERMQKFNKMNSENDLALKLPNAVSRGKREVKHDSGEYDTSSLSSYSYGYAPEPKAREWILKAARCDYAGMNKMASETPTLVKRKDINTALHWAAKNGHVDLVKLLAGTYKSHVNAKSNGGYTPLHLAAQFSRQEVYDVLVTVYNADTNVRDHSGKKPMQYLLRQDTSVSVDTFKKLKEKRRSTEIRERESLGNSFLRIGSLNVRVKKTTEAFGNFLGKSHSASHIERIINKKWGSSESLPETEMTEKDKELMPPPSLTNNSKSGSSGSSKVTKVKSRKHIQPPSSPSQQHRLVPMIGENATIAEDESGSESDTACGFGSDWKNPA